MKALHAAVAQKMIEFYQGSIHDIEHFLKVHAYAAVIGAAEHLDEMTLDILEAAAIVHDIACPLCREKYGNVSGRHQEEESEALLRPFLQEFSLDAAVLDRIVFLVAHHHTVSDIDGIDYQILLEADFLVNASEGKMSADCIRSFRDRIARTESAKWLLDSVYLH